jgi:hypothetical protein
VARKVLWQNVMDREHEVLLRHSTAWTKNNARGPKALAPVCERTNLSCEVLSVCRAVESNDSKQSVAAAIFVTTALCNFANQGHCTRGVIKNHVCLGRSSVQIF